TYSPTRFLHDALPILHKLRDAMARHNEQDYLTGIVRLNVGISGRKQIRKFSGLHPGEKPFVIGGVMSGDKNSTVRKIMLMQDSRSEEHTSELQSREKL